MRKGRSVVHKNLEDNYGAVVVANHEALAQVLEQVNNNFFFLHTLHAGQLILLGKRVCFYLTYLQRQLPFRYK